MADRFLNPQQEEFLHNYTNPKSPTFGNALQSALKAKYGQEYAESITYQLPEWLSESLGDMKRLRKAEKNLDEVQNMDIYNEDGKPDAQLIDKRTKVDLFIAETLGKDKYSKRTDITSKGESIVFMPTEVLNKINDNPTQEASGDNQ